MGRDEVALCRMFNRATSGQSLPTYLSADHDPRYRFHQWQANLRILNIREIKTVPYVPCAHPVVERLIGTVRLECLDRLLFWTAADLERKLAEFQQYYNEHRTHARRDGRPAGAEPTRPAPTRVSGRIDGSRTVVASITRRKPRDDVDSQRIDSNDLRIRHSQPSRGDGGLWTASGRGCSVPRWYLPPEHWLTPGARQRGASRRRSALSGKMALGAQVAAPDSRRGLSGAIAPPGVGSSAWTGAVDRWSDSRGRQSLMKPGFCNVGARLNLGR